MSATTVRAKFRINSVTCHAAGFATGAVSLGPVSGKWNPETKQYEGENAAFWKATPNGSLQMQIDNPAGFEFFKENLGKDVYLDFTLAPVEEPQD